MNKGKSKKFLNNILAAALILLLGAGTVVFGVLYIDVTGVEFILAHKMLFEILLVVAASAFSVVAFIFYLSNKDFIYKLVVFCLALAVIALLVLYIVKISGLLDKVKSIDEFREYVASYGAFTVPIFILIQFLQVVILPIPGFVTIGAGVALFGPFYGSLYSIIGIVTASLVAFFIGRFPGYKVASWLVGKETLDKWMDIVKGKDKVVLTFMFLFPFFPDDILCFVAGLSSMSILYYTIMIIITRTINIVVSAYSIEGVLIPYNTWWGILIWAGILILTAAICYLLYKYGDRVEAGIKNFFTRKRKKNEDDSARRSQ